MSENNTDENAAGERAPLPENPKFPEGLRVLAVDDDPTSLKTLSVMLQKCKYQVTPMTNATEALALLRTNKDNYDIVITDVKMPDMDGFELLRIIGLEMDIPVIMMSVDDNTETVMKGVRHGARDYLVKPIRILELKNIWQHVMRKTVFNPEKSSLMTDEIVMGDLPLKKRRGRDKEKEDVNALSDGSSTIKKRRFAWTEDLHKKFVDAVHQLDADKAVPKQIVELMNEPELTREIVASHLQKYRNYLKKQQDLMTEARNFNAGQKGIHETFLNPTPTSYSDYKVLPILREASNGSSSGTGIISFREHLSRPDTLSNSRLNEMIGSINQQNLWSQQNYNPQMSNQAQAPRPISVLGNTPLAQSWVANPSGRMVFGDYVDMSSQIPNFSPVQPGPPLGFANFAGQSGHSGFPPCKLPPTEHASHPGPPGAFGIVGAPYQMLDGASTQISQSFQRNVLPGRHDGRVISTALNGGAGSDCRGYPVDFQAMDKSRASGQGAYMKLLTENMDNNHHNSLSSMDDELSTEGKQIGPTSAPRNDINFRISCEALEQKELKNLTEEKYPR